MTQADDIREPTAPDTSARERALSQIKKRRDFAAHLVTFVVVNGAAWLVWALTGSGYPWPAWVTVPWSVGLILNAWDVYLRRPITEEDIRREMDRGRGHPV